MTRIGLTLNEAKTSTKEACTERFDFLGYAFGPHRARTHDGVYLGMSPSHKSIFRLRQKVGDLLQPRNVGHGRRCEISSTEFCGAGRTYFRSGTTVTANVFFLHALNTLWSTKHEDLSITSRNLLHVKYRVCRFVAGEERFHLGILVTHPLHDSTFLGAQEGPSSI